jgi:SAM-dependent methyltransferase
MTSWLDFWGGTHSIYVNARHLEVHCARIGADLRSLLAYRNAPRLLDFGCGDALYAPRLTEAGMRVALYDGAPPVRARLAERFAGQPHITVLGEDDWRNLAPGKQDVILVNSVLQYLDPATLDALLDRWRDLLAPGGEILFADLIHPETGLLADVLDLLLPAARHGFLLAALVGLFATLLSDYRKLRTALGLARYRPDEFVARLARHGLKGERLAANIGLNAHRMTFRAVRA